LIGYGVEKNDLNGLNYEFKKKKIIKSINEIEGK
jgi:hypothetical protein